MGQLAWDERGATCTRCGTRFPLVGRVPCLVPDPPRFCLTQLRRFDEYMAITEARQRQIGMERRQEHLLPQTRERLLNLIHAMEVERALVVDLFGELLETVDRAAAESIPGGSLSNEGLALLDCYETTFRDWVWGDRENEAGRSMVEQLVAQATAAHGETSGAPAAGSLGQLAVFGAGACRLAVDVHRTLGPTATFALDINPFPLLMADKLVHGDAIDAYEYPLGPKSVAGVAVLQRLQKSFSIPDGLTIVISDALRPPFAAASLDTVLTPWFIDIVGVDVRQTAALVNRTLRAGGLWLNQGPLRFRGLPSQTYTIEEVREIALASGFEIVAETSADTPYFDSPISGQRRIETVYGFAARKVRETPRFEEPPSDPDWAIDVLLPIPLMPEYEAVRDRSVFNANVVSLIDGQRSIADLAIHFGKAWSADPRSLIEPLRGFVLELTRR